MFIYSLFIVFFYVFFFFTRLTSGISLPGTVSITSAELYFEVNEESDEFRNADPNVLRYLVFFFWNEASLFIFADISCLLGVGIICSLLLQNLKFKVLY